MVSNIFINLPVKDLDKSIAFFKALGFDFNPQFTDKNATCMIVSENIFVMLLVEPYFKTFISKQISDAKNTTEVLLSLQVDSREEVENLVSKAIKAGGTPSSEPRDHGFMYQHGFQDLEGHIWEVFYMDQTKFEEMSKNQ